MTLQQKRHREVTITLNRTIAQRDGCLANLVRYETRLKTLRRQVQRLERAMAAPPKPKLEPKPVVSDVTEIPFSELPIADSLEIPTFLQRKRAADLRDKKAREEIAAEKEARAQAKKDSKGVVRQSKKLGPNAARMPLTGRAAMEAIRQR